MDAERDGHELSNLPAAKAYDSQSDGMSRREYLDRQQLARLGKQSVLKRNFGFMSILGFSCTVLITWEGSLILFSQGLVNGGSAGVIYSFLLVWLGNIAVFSTLSELVSMAPTSGGQYHWVAMLAPRSCAKFLSYVTGWLTVAGWQGSVASGGYLTGTLIQGLIVLTVPSYSPEPYQGTLLFWAVILFSVLINSVVSSALPKFEGLILILHVLGFFAVLIPLVVLGPHGDAKEVFSSFANGGGWPTQGLSFFVGLIGNAFAFIGADAAFHMSEEIHNPSVVVPRSIMLSMLFNGSTGFAMMLTVLFCMGDIQNALSSPTNYPCIEIFLQATNSVSGSAVMTAIVTILAGCSTVGLLASTSRVFWAFARDNGLPFSSTLSQVDPRTSVPIWSVSVTAVIACLLALINIGSSTALNDILSLSISCLYSSYFIAVSLLLYRRCTQGFQIPDPTEYPALASTAAGELVWGPWHVPGVFGIINNTFACVYLIVVWFFSFWPPSTPVQASTMNYSSLVTGTVVIFSIVYYLVRAKSKYNGPIVEI